MKVSLRRCLPPVAESVGPEDSGGPRRRSRVFAMSALAAWMLVGVTGSASAADPDASLAGATLTVSFNPGFEYEPGSCVIFATEQDAVAGPNGNRLYASPYAPTGFPAGGTVSGGALRSTFSLSNGASGLSGRGSWSLTVDEFQPGSTCDELRLSASGTYSSFWFGSFDDSVSGTVDLTIGPDGTGGLVAQYRFDPPSGPDADNDGVDDAIGTGGGVFDDGAGTAGVVVDRAGLDLLVTDADPGGVRITAAGSGGPAIVTVCGYTISIATATSATVTCGSITVQTESGLVNVGLSNGDSVSVPPGAAAHIDEVIPSFYRVDSVGSAAIIQTVGGRATPLAPGTTGGTVPLTKDDCKKNGGRGTASSGIRVPVSST